MNRQFLLTVLLAAIAGSTWWWLEAESPEQPPSPPREHRPDYIVDQFHATQMDAAGELTRQLEAIELRHFPDDGSSELERPILTVFTEAGPPWVARADTGWVSRDGELLRLRGDVVIRRAASRGNRPVRVQTEALRVRPQREYAETDLPVSLESAQSSVNSIGMRAWFGESLRVQLLGRSHALLYTDD